MTLVTAVHHANVKAETLNFYPLQATEGQFEPCSAHYRKILLSLLLTISSLYICVTLKLREAVASHTVGRDLGCIV